MFRYQGREVNINAPLLVNGKWEHNLTDPAVRARIGIEEVPDPVWPDLRFYNAYKNTDGSLNVERRAKTAIEDTLWSHIEGRRNTAQQGGCPVDVDGTVYWFHNDLISRTQWQRMSYRAQRELDQGGLESDPYLIDGHQVPWKTMSKVKLPLTLGIVVAVADATESREAYLHGFAEALMDAVRATDEQEQVDLDAGWPLTYAEQVAADNEPPEPVEGP